jgi:hypothetical protein
MALKTTQDFHATFLRDLLLKVIRANAAVQSEVLRRSGRNCPDSFTKTHAIYSIGAGKIAIQTDFNHGSRVMLGNDKPIG